MSRTSLGLTLPSFVDRYPERDPAPASGLNHLFHRSVGRLGTSARRLQRQSLRQADRVADRQADLVAVADGELKRRARALQQSLRARGFDDDNVIDGFALLREVARRTIRLTHYRTQIAAGLVMLDGAIAEMATGEGKTLALTLPAGLVALAGIPVHVITVNDYLAHRDRTAMAPIFEFVGLSVGEVVGASTAEERQAAYRCDLSYCANNEIVFDYLRDRLLLGDRTSPAQLQFEASYGDRSRLQRLNLDGLRFAIVDEADSVLVDETRTPLILSAPGADDDRAGIVCEALKLEAELRPDEHFTLAPLRFGVELTPAGQDRLDTLAEDLGGVWRSRRLREQLVRQAIAARYLYLRDRHYVVRDGEVLLVDQHTGRIMPGRKWSEGMHQFVEAKEACHITPDPGTLARVSYQSFFRRYVALAGMTGTAREVAGELWSVYGLRVVPIPTRLPSQRRCLGRTTLKSADEKFRAITAAVAARHARGAPVLVGTGSIATSERVSACLSEAALEHVVLNAKQDDREAEIVASAGEVGRITVATNMAGRGTDIKLGPGAADAGGLHVILTEYHDAGRIDRQLVGRAARQGDPGSYEVIAALDDPIIADTGSRTIRVCAWLLVRCPAPLAGRLGSLLLRRAQRRVEREYSGMRQRLLRADDEQTSRLAFAGRAE